MQLKIVYYNSYTSKTFSLQNTHWYVRRNLFIYQDIGVKYYEVKMFATMFSYNFFVMFFNVSIRTRIYIWVLICVTSRLNPGKD